MKNLLFLLAFVLVAGFAQAQDGERALRKAGNAFSAYNIDPSNNKSKLQEAVTEIELAMADATIAATPKAWQTKGEIYSEIANQITSIRQVGLGNADDLPKVENPALIAYEAFARAFELGVKKFEKKDALKGLQATQGSLYNLGIYAYEDGAYASAFMNFEGVLKIHDMLKQNGEASSLEEGTAYNDQLYITGLAALNAEKLAEARPYFQKLYDAKSDKPAVYEALYRIASEDNIEAAYTYLEEGRRLHPDDVSLLFAEINHFLRINKLDALITKLQAAIEKEPGNISLYSTLGNVYDNLYQREFEAGNKAKADEYFQQALSYYNQALGRDPQYFDAIYSIGALYFNRAAVLTKEQISLGVSAADQKRFDELANLINGDFEKALPYFKQCEQINPNDQNTLIALKEIFARKNDFTVSGEFKTRLEKVQGGGKNETSYFKN